MVKTNLTVMKAMLRHAYIEFEETIVPKGQEPKGGVYLHTDAHGVEFLFINGKLESVVKFV